MLSNIDVRGTALSILAMFVTAARLAAFTPDEIAAESAKANAFFDRVFDARVERRPEFATYLGMKKNYDKWDDDSEANQIAEFRHTIADYEELKRTIDFGKLNAPTKVSYRLWVRSVENQISGWQWRQHNYPVNQMFGQHAGIPSFLINNHRIDNVDDARAYIARLRGINTKVGELIAEIEVREARGIMPPKFVFPMVLEACHKIVSGAPFDESGKDSPLLEDFRTKVGKLKEVSDEDKAALIAEARKALLEVTRPAYAKLIAVLEGQESRATTDDGVWKFPQGGDYYNRALFVWTTTHYTADQIHEIGLSEVKRIHAEMDKIRQQVGFEGDLKAFGESLRTDPKFFLPATDEGRQQYLDIVNKDLDAIRVQLPKIFKTLPKAELVVKPVEPYREKGAAQAFYQQPAIDGSRPGIYYVNLSDMSEMATYQIEGIAYHEAIPGHHMQIAIAQELTDMPKFRKMGFSAAYTEGWGLYAERLGKELGGYKDPYSEFGRLSLELLRAGRLVADTGIHAKHWTREQAIEWMFENLPSPRNEIKNEVERYIVLPGQATAYKIGQLKILELRARGEGTRRQVRPFRIPRRHPVQRPRAARVSRRDGERVDRVKKGMTAISRRRR